ncbi:MAG TPA: trehalose-6-phosphate synthase, partial [Gemmatimonadales bacterium]|nr:trehalose-6-phosphate synthase [Gemmatimonadales bacterium]
MRLSLRFVIPLLLVLTALAYAVLPLVDKLTVRWFMRDLDIRAGLVARTAQDAVHEAVAAGDAARLRRYFRRLTEDERLFGVGLCPAGGGALVAADTLPTGVDCAALDRFRTPDGQLLQSDHGPLLVSAIPLASDSAADGTLVVVHDMSFVERRSEETRRYVFAFFGGLAVVVSLLTVVIAHLSWRGWVEGMRSLLRGELLLRPAGTVEKAEFGPIIGDLRTLLRDLEAGPGVRDHEQAAWTPETLRHLLQEELRGHEMLVVSNREPVIHVHDGDRIAVQRPASGLVTAIEPILRACSGTWIAHGSGSADREVVDAKDHVGVPPEHPDYRLRRVWLTPEEEAGYYYGFSNEGLWPLCHIAHVRPTFRTADWEQYVRVNRRFAQAVVAEADSPDPIVLVQDYHFALLPRMVRDLLPGATIITFWHIPWPNPEAFGICPWREELLDGLLGSSILGFHTQFHCNNFLDTVDRQLEARVDRETFAVSYRGQRTLVKRYPISVAWPPAEARSSHPVGTTRSLVRDRLGLPPDQAIGIGVDRMDYTKGLEERFRAVERLMEQFPEWIGRFTFVQIAAPTRSSIEQYHAYSDRVHALADRINQKFANRRAPAIILRAEHHDAHEVFEFYRAADLCFVSSLHDGMNLVAKEFVAAREDEDGVLVLSTFAGASRELVEAL